MNNEVSKFLLNQVTNTVKSVTYVVKSNAIEITLKGVRVLSQNKDSNEITFEISNAFTPSISHSTDEPTSEYQSLTATADSISLPSTFGDDNKENEEKHQSLNRIEDNSKQTTDEQFIDNIAEEISLETNVGMSILTTKFCTLAICLNFL